jgi:hypothetical protein
MKYIVRNVKTSYASLAGKVMNVKRFVSALGAKSI